MIYCDRQQFIDCTNGDLMIRNSKAQITHLGDGASSAVEAAEKGEEVILTVKGKSFSRMKKFVETRL